MDSNDPFQKGTPIRMTGELANAPRAGSGTVTLKRELVVPLAEFNAPVDKDETFVFWPFLTPEGVKWAYQYKGYPEYKMGLFEEVEA